MNEPLVMFYVSFYGLFALLCFVAGYKRIKKERKRQKEQELRDSFRLIKGEKDDPKD